MEVSPAAAKCYHSIAMKNPMNVTGGCIVISVEILV